MEKELFDRDDGGRYEKGWENDVREGKNIVNYDNKDNYERSYKNDNKEEKDHQ